jgi:hypothetical protein
MLEQKQALHPSPQRLSTSFSLPVLPPSITEILLKASPILFHRSSQLLKMWTVHQHMHHCLSCAACTFILLGKAEDSGVGSYP